MKHFLSSLVAVALFITPLWSYAAGAASMRFDQTSYTAAAGDLFEAVVSIDPVGEALDTARAVVTFDPSVVSVQGVRLVGSFNRVAPGNYWDNTSGRLSWGAFTLDGPITAATPFISVTFLAHTTGDGNIRISADSRAISDGEEKIDAGALGLATVTVGASTTSEPGAAFIVVESSSHANDVDWYAINTVDFSWTNLEGESPLTAYYVAFDESAQTDPNTDLAATTTQKSFEGVADGVHYFHVKGIHADGRETAIVHRRVNVDATAPNPIELRAQDSKILEGETAILTFATIDEMSGVVQYQIAINGSEYQVQESPMEMTDLTPGTYFFRVAALDRAGNTSYGSTSVRVYPAGTDLGRPEGYEGSSELAAITQAQGDETATAGESRNLLISILLGIAFIICIIYAIIKGRRKS